MKKILSLLFAIVILLNTQMVVFVDQGAPSAGARATATDSTVMTYGRYDYEFYLWCTTLITYCKGESDGDRPMDIYLRTRIEINNYVVDTAYGLNNIQADTYNPNDNEMLRWGYATCSIPETALSEQLSAGYN